LLENLPPAQRLALEVSLFVAAIDRRVATLAIACSAVVQRRDRPRIDCLG
jgi:hypothetical protein